MKCLSLKHCCRPEGRYISGIHSHRRRRWYRTQNYVTMIDSKLLGLKKAKQGKTRQNSSGFLFVRLYYSETSKYGYWLQLPYSSFESYVYICCRNAYARLLSDAFLRVLVALPWLLKKLLRFRLQHKSIVWLRKGMLLHIYTSTHELSCYNYLVYFNRHRYHNAFFFKHVHKFS